MTAPTVLRIPIDVVRVDRFSGVGWGVGRRE
jgi:hypothetical protein